MVKVETRIQLAIKEILEGETWKHLKTNNNFELFEQAIAGYQDVSIAGGAQTTALLMSDATVSNARNAVIKLSGIMSSKLLMHNPYQIFQRLSGICTLLHFD